ncbi:MAG TPA: hypothetical protein VJ728_14460 [Candidatus Binataceae bacterium]|nr:hypothetical protein [Candidatus Binataceae bacterium]
MVLIILGHSSCYSVFLLALTALVSVALLLLTVGSGMAQSPPYLGSVSFKVLNANGTKLVGHSHYELTPAGDDLLIGHGDAHFQDGEYDVEYDTLKARPGNAPAMLTLDHKFYNADGSMQREIAADFRTGEASCTRYKNGVAQVDRAKLDFTPDSYGGSAVVLPVERDLAHGITKPIKLQALNCIPKPRLISVKAYVRRPSRWSHYPGETVEVDIKPTLGWLDAVVAPFLPELRAWFVPSDNWIFVGGKFSRYYRGPQITLVREHSPEIGKAQDHNKGGSG